MSIKLGSNIASLKAQRRLGEATDSLSTVYERLASGQRINRASDDAAGLAIADDLEARGRIYTQAIRNANDGISILNIADSAIDALTSVVTRIRELSEQSANGTYSNKQREALDAEAQQLSKEFTRITQSTSFNGLKVFDGSLGAGVRLQLGIGIDESINASVGGAIGTGGFLSASAVSADGDRVEAMTLADVNGDGILDIVTAGSSVVGGTHGIATIQLGTGNGNFGSLRSYTMDANTSASVSMGDLNGDGILDLVTAGFSSVGGAHGTATVRLGTGNGNFGAAQRYTTETDNTYSLALGDLNGDGILDMVTAGTSSSSSGTTSVRLGSGNGTFGSAQTFAADDRNTFAVSLGDLNGDGILDMITAGYSNTGLSHGTSTVRLGTGNGSFGAAQTFTAGADYSFDLSLGDLNGDGKLDLVSVGRSGSGGYHGAATVWLGTGTGGFGSAQTYTADSSFTYVVSLGDLNGDGILDLLTGGRSAGSAAMNTVRLGTGNGNFGALRVYTTDGNRVEAVEVGDLNGDGVLDLVTAGYTTSSGFRAVAAVRMANTKEGLGALLEFSLKTRPDSLRAMAILDRTLQNLAKQRGTIGASQSRVNIAINNLQSAKENFAAAEGRIRDADIAAESAALVRTQIRQQAAASVLSQANQLPALALQLLG